MRLSHRSTRLGVLLLAFLWAAPAAATDFKVVANSSVPVETIQRKELARVFMKKQIRWSNGTAVVPVDQAPDSPVRADFSRAVHQKDTAAVTAYWQRQIFSGRDVPPVTRASDNEVLAFVRATRGAIGYVEARTSAEGVKVVALQ